MTERYENYMQSLISPQRRDQVSSMPASEWQAALRLARSIEGAWFRCQALSHVATVCPISKVSLEIVDEALAAADSIPDINRKVSVSALPIRVALLCRQEQLAIRETARHLELLQFEPNPVRCMDACAVFIQQLAQEATCLQLALNAFLKHAGQARSWKVAYDTLGIAPVIAMRMPERLPELRALLIKKRFASRFDAVCGISSATSVS